MIVKKIASKYRGLSIQAKSALWFGMCSVLQKGISMITVPIFTRLLTPEEYGTYNIFLSWLTCIYIITSLNLFYGVFNNAMLKYQDDRDRYISSMQGLVCCSTAVIFVIYLLGRRQFNAWIGLSTLMMCLMFLDMLVTPALQFWSARYRFEYKYRTLVSVTLLQSVLNPIVGVIAVLFSREKVLARVGSIVLVDVVVCGLIAIHQFYKGKCFYHKKYWRYAFFFNLPLIPHYLSGILLNQGDRIMIDKMVGKYEVATYSVAYGIGMLLNIVLTALNGAFTPWMYTKLNEHGNKEIAKTTNILMSAMAGIMVALVSFAPEVIRVFAPIEYYEAVYVVPPVAASVFFNLLYAFFSNIEFYYEKTRFILVASISAAILNILLNAFFIPRFGYLAAGYTTLASYILYCYAHFLFYKQICMQESITEPVFDGKYLLLLSASVVGIAIVVSLLYRFTVIRFGLIASFLILAYIKRKKLLMFIQMFRQIKTDK